MMKLLALALALLLLLSLASCERKEFLPPEKQTLISLTENGKVEYYPDEGFLRLEVSCVKLNLQKSKECVAEQDNALRKAYAALGVPDSMVSSGPVSRRKVYDWVPKKGDVFKGYETEKSLSVEVVGLETLEAAIDATLGFKDVRLYGTSYSHTRYDSLKTAAYLNAISRLQERMEHIQKSVGLGKCKILSISDSPIGVSSEVETPSSPRKRAGGGGLPSGGFNDGYGQGGAGGLSDLLGGVINAKPSKKTVYAEASMLIGCDAI
jgi:uncharacterized protein YggE